MNKIDKIIKFCDEIKDKIQRWQYESIIDYLNHNESGVAVELLLDYLYEEDVFINESQMKDLKIIYSNQNFPINTNSFILLKKIIDM